MERKDGSVGAVGWYYALPALPLSAVAMTFYVFVPKYYTDLGISLKIMGILVLSSRIWDAILDPIIGRLSDLTPRKYGRRRPWILFGSFPLAVFCGLLLTPSLCPDWCSITTWFAATTFLFFFFWAIVNVPYEALGAEICEEYDQRTAVLARRDGLILLGTVLGSVLPELFKTFFPGVPAVQMAGLAILYVVIIILSILPCVLRVPERVSEISEEPSTLVFRAFFETLKNRNFLILLLAFAVSSFSATLPATLILYYVEGVLGSQKAPYFLGLYLLVGCLALPAWVRISRRLEKRLTWMVALLLNTLSFFGVFFLGAGEEFLYGVLVILSGLGVGAILALPSSMLADTIDFDESVSGYRREGLYVGVWSVIRKASAALAAGLGLLVLDWAGYESNSSGPLSEGVNFWLRFLYAGVPCAGNILALLIIVPYSLTRADHERIRREIGERSHG